MPLSTESIQAAIHNYNMCCLITDDPDAPIMLLTGIVNDQIPNAKDEIKSYYS